MKPAWDKLGAEYQDNAHVVIADVDCTQHQDLCGKHDVSGYPTIKYYEQGEPKKYQGGRDFDSLKKFVVDNLEVKCSFEETEGCSEKELKFMELAKSKDAAWVEKQTTRLGKMKAGKMKASLKQWVVQRLAILTQLADQGTKDEL